MSLYCSNLNCGVEIQPADAYICTCRKVAFCSKKHFKEDPHSSIEDDEHAYMNELSNNTVDVKLSRLVGRGGYIDLMAELTTAMSKGSVTDAVREQIAAKFAKQTSKKNAAFMKTKIAGMINSYNSATIGQFDAKVLLKIWKGDSPRTGEQIQVAAAEFLAASQARADGYSAEKNERLFDAGYALGIALNGDRKQLA